jgi:integrase
MRDTIKVSVVSAGPGRALLLKWIDPETHERRFKSAKTKKRAEANQQAGLLAKELTQGKYAGGRNTPWLDFTIRYTDEVLSGLAVKTRAQLATVFKTVERLSAPARIGDITAARLSKLVGALREEGKSPYTVRNYMAHFRASLAWAVSVGMLSAVPAFPSIPRAKNQKSMKGRPITEREFQAMLDATAGVVGEAAADSWRHYLRSLWFNGLRLRESLEVYWDRPDKLCVDLSGAFPMLRIPADLQKNNRDTLWPIAPEWGDMLLAVPAAERHGPVFRLLATAGDGDPRQGGTVSDPNYVCHVVGWIGKAAGVVVNRTTKMRMNEETGRREPVEVVKYASCHDLRRSFGFRWADRVDTFKLQELMRHSSIETTRRFYVGRNAQNTAANLWAARDRAAGSGEPGRNTFDNNGATGQPAAVQETTQPPALQGV